MLEILQIIQLIAPLEAMVSVSRDLKKYIAVTAGSGKRVDLFCAKIICQASFAVSGGNDGPYPLARRKKRNKGSSALLSSASAILLHCKYC